MLPEVCSSAAAPVSFTGASFDVSPTSNLDPVGDANDFSVVGPNVSGAYQTSNFVFGKPTAGDPGVFVLCWAHSANYVFRVGTFQISGPFTRDAQCTLTEACALELSGIGLAPTNMVRILPSSSACSDNVTSGISVWWSTVTATP